MKLLITGGCGFIGSNFVRMALSRKAEIVNVDSLTYAGNPENLADISKHESYRFHKCDIRDATGLESLFASEKHIDALVNFAAESHVDRSIENPLDFVSTNVLGTANLLLLARKFDIPRFVQISTDEVYGSLGEEDKPFRESFPLKPNSPYSASKAGADLFVRSYFETHKYPTIITRCSNNYGPFQFPEKLIPVLATNCMQNKNLPIYADGRNIRDWIYVEDHCEGIWAAMEKGKPGEIYNFGGNAERRNITVAQTVLNAFPKTASKIEHVQDRPGHDFRYAMNIEKAQRELNWQPKHRFEDGIAQTIRWYQENEAWWRPLNE